MKEEGTATAGISIRMDNIKRNSMAQYKFDYAHSKDESPSGSQLMHNDDSFMDTLRDVKSKINDRRSKLASNMGSQPPMRTP